MADKDDLKKELADIASKHDNLEVQSADYDEHTGQLEMRLAVKGGPQAPQLPDNVEIIGKESAADLIGDNPIMPIHKARGSRSLLELDPLGRNDLDLAKPSVLSDDPSALIQRSIDYYRSKDVYGSAINVLTNFAAKGFENDIDDPEIKAFFDNWVLDTGFDKTVEDIFFDLFRAGLVRTYKIMGRYQPDINFLSSQPKMPEDANLATGKEVAISRNRYSRTHVPIRYTILNPTMVVIKGSLMFGQTATFLKKKAGEEIKVLLEMPAKDLSDFQKKIIKNLPAQFKKAVLAGDDIPLDPNLVGEVDYRRMPYERYPVPRGARAFEPVEFKDELRKADYSTLDGITNYILLIKVGNDQYPIQKQETLERASELFDTVSKSYKVVWNHTLNVEKVTSPEIGEVLGQDKYKQVNEDVTGAVGVVRALIDGLGNANTAAYELSVKSVIEEINYARRQVARWIYKEYRDVARAMGFDRIPKVRFDDMALRDEVQMMALIQGMIDRRIISYRTGQKALGFDPETELAQMKQEKKLIQDGVLGLVGSPFQQSGNQNTQPTQNTPKGTPSEGRPKAQPAPKKPDDKDAPRPSGAPPKGKSAASADVIVPAADEEIVPVGVMDVTENILKNMTIEELEEALKKKREKESHHGDKKKPAKKPVKKTTRRKKKSPPKK
jgi:hypothetical protein